MKFRYLFTAIIIFLISYVGGLFTKGGMDWYNNLTLMDWTPSGKIIGLVWTILFMLMYLAVNVFWKVGKNKPFFIVVAWLFLFNAILNVFWSYLFFGIHNFPAAVIEMIVLNITTLLIIVFSFRISYWVSLLLLPYFLWVSFATYLAYSIWQLN